MIVSTLRVERVSKYFGGVRALDDVSLDVPQGATVGLIGPNGAGKTTLFNVLTGYTRPDGGRVYLRGRDVTNLPPHRICQAGVGRTFQITKVFRDLTAFENVMVAAFAGQKRSLTLYWPAKGMATGETGKLLELVGLGRQLKVRAGNLSHPDQKRLEIAVALAGNPSLLLLDEPTSGMSVQDRSDIVQAIDRVRASRAVTTVLIEHDMSSIFALCQEIVVLHQGRVISAGSPQAIQQDGQVQQVYLGGSTVAKA